MDPSALIHVAGHRGLVGSAIVRQLHRKGYANLLLRSRDELDLTNQAAVDAFYEQEKPTHVFLAAARVGGIHANSTYPADFIRDNLAIQCNVIHSAWKHGVKKLLFLGSSCIYPRDCAQPIREDYLLSGPLEPTNAPYAIAKIAGVAMCQAYRMQHGFDAIAAMPTNLYGPGDNFHQQNSHVIPALVRRFADAKDKQLSEVVVWGTGTPLREFLYSDDLGDALVLLMQNYSSPDPVNIGSGEEVSIADVARVIAEEVGYGGKLRFDDSKPDGTPRKLLDSSKIMSLGWRPRIGLREGIGLVLRELDNAKT